MFSSKSKLNNVDDYKLKRISFQMNYSAPPLSDYYYVDNIDYWTGVMTCVSFGKMMEEERYSNIVNSLSQELIAGISTPPKPLLQEGASIETAMVNPALKDPERFNDPFAYFDIMADYYQDTGMICTYMPHARSAPHEKNDYIVEGTVLVSYAPARDEGSRTNITDVNQDAKYIFLAWCEQKGLVDNLEDNGELSPVQIQRYRDKLNDGRATLKKFGTENRNQSP